MYLYYYVLKKINDENKPHIFKTLKKNGATGLQLCNYYTNTLVV